MHCPRCGQQQISDQTKFCSRCGFQLGLVAELLVHGGFLPQLADVYRKRKFFNRRNGVMFSLFWFMFFLFIMTPFWGIVNVEELAALSAVIGIFGSLMLLIGSLTFLQKTPSQLDLPGLETTGPNRSALYGPANHTALPPQQNQPAAEYMAPAGEWRAPDTGNLVRPPSVTEDTTKLLKKED